ncbi:MDH-like protein, partial [Mya arenaria]
MANIKLSRLFKAKLNPYFRLSSCKLSDFTPENRWDAVPKSEVERFIIDCMIKVGTKRDHAVSLANNLMTADYRGHYSHGLNRLGISGFMIIMYCDMYVHDIQSGITVSDAEPKIVKETAATAFVNGNNVLGPVVGNLCMQTAIKKAKESSNHYGIAGWYAMQATPAKNGDSFVLDMATSTVALGKVSTEPKSVLNGGGLMPLGGAEETGGYKGYGLAMMVEIFCGILSNASYGPNVRRWKNTDRIANL